MREILFLNGSVRYQPFYESVRLEKKVLKSHFGDFVYR